MASCFLLVADPGKAGSAARCLTQYCNICGMDFSRPSIAAAVCAETSSRFADPGGPGVGVAPACAAVTPEIHSPSSRAAADTARGSSAAGFAVDAAVDLGACAAAFRLSEGLAAGGLNVTDSRAATLDTSRELVDVLAMSAADVGASGTFADVATAAGDLHVLGVFARAALVDAFADFAAVVPIADALDTFDVESSATASLASVGFAAAATDADAGGTMVVLGMIVCAAALVVFGNFAVAAAAAAAFNALGGISPAATLVVLARSDVIVLVGVTCLSAAGTSFEAVDVVICAAAVDASDAFAAAVNTLGVLAAAVGAGSLRASSLNLNPVAAAFDLVTLDFGICLAAACTAVGVPAESPAAVAAADVAASEAAA